MRQMPSTKGYYLKPCNRTSIPRCVIGVHCVTRPAENGVWTERRRDSELAAVVTSHTLRNWSGWTPVQTIAHGSHHAFWEWLEDESWQQRRIHLFAPNANTAATLLRLFDRWGMMGLRRSSPSTTGATGADFGSATTGYLLSQMIQTHRVTVLDYTRLGVRYIWTSLSQYLPLSEREIAEMVGVRYPTDEQEEQAEEASRQTGYAPSYLTVRAVQHIADWWKSHKGGPWGNSIGALASRFLRSRLHSRTLCTHRHADALSLERRACYGGRVSCWYVGDVASRVTFLGNTANRPPRCSYSPLDGPVFSVDIQSMYPHLLSTHCYPTKLIGYERGMTIADLEVLLRYVCIVAHVSINTDQAEYPYRDSSSVYYPTGSFNTVLCGPELSYAIRHNHITKVHTAALYQSGTPFAGAACELLAARVQANGGRRSPAGRIVKLLSNAISGTLAQRRTEWIPCPGASPPLDEFGEPIRWGPFTVSRPDRQWDAQSDPRHAIMTGDTERYRPRLIDRYRVVAGLVERLQRSEVGTGTLQACYAYLTAHGRSLMRDIRTCMPARSVLIQDTDGLWVTEAGYDALVTRAETFGTLPGRLEVDKRIQLARIYGPKHYWYDGKWVLSGYHDPSYDSCSGTFTDTRSSNPFLGTPTEPPYQVTEYTRESELQLLHMHGHQGDDGWITPYHLSEGVKQHPADRLRSDDSR